ncbi:MAG: tRNA (adenosine(37)-N6)-dimethylallyltransferase MiaA [Bacteroidales bacterium]|nr:tRNA (adenosine(37)-N6)-dimethylallyltransferase MiaA [Bacteroidales bacterium]
MKTLVVLTGPTGVGKTELSLRIAEALGSPVLSCDSRQIFREMPVGTAAPTQDQLKRVKHYFIANHSIHDYYSAARFETDVLSLLEQELFPKHDTILMTGGSMMYIDAVCKGIDDMPDVDEDLRKELLEKYRNEGLDAILAELKLLDPDYYNQVDQKNHKRVIHGLEICLMTGLPFSSFRQNATKKRPFRIIKICLNRDRTELYSRIDERVLEMVQQGLCEEARSLYPFRTLNALNTVGYKEMFAHFDGDISLDQAIVNIQNNTHKYARKQLTWFRKDKENQWFHPENLAEINQYLETNCPGYPKTGF